ncbi:sensor histidine kinase [Undibacterium sp. TJN25]|uniref:sensor histidine kinase n=1 Tax=Undibacterium sp. TJN25 TaxID=3413056 RepID=UPI003BF013A9
MNLAIAADISAVQAIGAVPTILQALSDMTGLGFTAVARVTKDSWTTCAVLDKLNFGLKVGDGLDVTTTLCEEVRDSGAAIIIDHVSASVKYHDHHTPRIYGFQSYFSIPLFRPSGEYFGTLCGLDPKPADLSNQATVATMTLFAQLISLQLEDEKKLEETHAALLGERETAELREQFIAVLGHDLRTPLASIISGTDILLFRPPDEKSVAIIERIRRSAYRISTLVDDVLDFTRGRMGGGISLDMRHESNLAAGLQQVVEEVRSAFPGREIRADIAIADTVLCDVARLGQLLSNLLNNALVHGASDQPVRVVARGSGGRLEIAVTNHGPAIPQEIIAQLFKPYWRGAAKAPQDGLGLGLFIVAEIARSHRAKLDVVSTEQATSFIFTL